MGDENEHVERQADGRMNGPTGKCEEFIMRFLIQNIQICKKAEQV